MNRGDKRIAEAAVELASRLPPETIEIVTTAIRRSSVSGSASPRARILEDLPHPYYRDLAMDFLDCWQKHAQHVSSREVASALLAAAHAERTHRESRSVELVWTGPEADAVPFRRTEQAILQVLDSARQRITLVSYAVYKIPHVSQALVQAAGRGVQIVVIVETPDRVEGQSEYSTLKALGEDVASCARVYYWPEAQRTHDPTGRHGILHVKCAVADGRWLFLSSANLTEYAFHLNMELGLLVTGGPLPAQAEGHFDRLVGSGVLKKV